MKNNNGQVLIAFILLLPLLIMFAGLIIDVGYLYIEKRHTDNNVKDVINYSLKHIDSEENVLESNIKKQLKLNIEDIDLIDIKVENKTIEVSLEKVKKSIFTLIFSKYEYKISSHYRGYINEDKIVIRKV